MGIDFLTEYLQLEVGRRCRGTQVLQNSQLKPSCSLYLLKVHAGMKTENLHALRALVKAQDREIRYHAVGTGPWWKSRSLACRRPGQVTGSGEEIQLLDKTPAVVCSHHEDTPTQRGQVVGSAAAGQPDLRGRVVAADHRGVEIAVWVELCGTEEGLG